MQETHSDVLGTALWQHFSGESRAKLWVHDQFGPKVEMELPIYFRNEDGMPDLELLALDRCQGKILDIGAGAGSHALALQDQGKNVYACDISAGAVRVMQTRGVEHASLQNVFDMQAKEFDTLLMLMNGIGLTGNIAGLHSFLRHAKKLLRKGGQILCDSSDLNYLYEDGLPKPDDRYYGEVCCRYEFKKMFSEWFWWLYADRNILAKVARAEGFKTEVLIEDVTGQFLARLTSA